MDAEPPDKAEGRERSDPSLFDLVSSSIRVGSVRISVAALLAALTAGAGVTGYALRGNVPTTAATTSSVPTSQTNPSPLSAAPSASSAASVVAPSVEPRESDLARLKSLEKKPARERTIEESVELARGHERLGIEEVASFGPALEAGKVETTTWRRLRQLARDDVIAPGALALVAAHPSPEGADFIYDVAHDARASEPNRFLADDLLARAPIRAAASKPLALALDLESAHACEAVRKVVERAKATADDRSLPLLGLLDKEKGCGKESKEDCFACLRGSTLLFEAREAARGRSFSPQWGSTLP